MWKELKFVLDTTNPIPDTYLYTFDTIDRNPNLRPNINPLKGIKSYRHFAYSPYPTGQNKCFEKTDTTFALSPFPNSKRTKKQ